MKKFIILVFISLPLFGCSASIGTTPATTSTTTYTATPMSSTTYTTEVPAAKTTVVEHY